MTARFARLNLERFVGLALIATLAITLAPNVTFAAESEISAQNKTKLVFEIKNFPTIVIPDGPVIRVPTVNELINLTKNGADSKSDEQEKIKVEQVETLTAYLAKKNSPLAEQAEHLLDQRDWKLIIAISQAESNMCKRQLGYNCWGIGGGNHRKYPNLQTAILDAQTVIGKYVDSGRDTPEKMLTRYVGWQNYNWVKAVNQVLSQLNQLELEA